MWNTVKSVVSALFVSLILSLPALAQNIPELNLSRSGLALRGVDPVSYFTAGEPQKGSRSITTEHAGGTYRFVSEESRKQFLRDPDKYPPKYGGYCAYGTAVGAKVEGDPYLWSIVDGELYLNINRSVDRLWKTNIPGFIEQADDNWPGLKFQ